MAEEEQQSSEELWGNTPEYGEDPAKAEPVPEEPEPEEEEEEGGPPPPPLPNSNAIVVSPRRTGATGWR